MRLAYLLSGGAPHVKRYKIGSDCATLGMPIEAGIAGEAGVQKFADPTVITDAVGVNVDGDTFSTTQGAGNEGVIGVIINPDAVYQARICTTATSGTQSQIITNSAASTGGTVVTITTGDQDPSGTSMDEGFAACIAGGNVGQIRKVTSVAATSVTVTVPFERTIAVGDVFMVGPWSPSPDVTGDQAQLTTDGIEVRNDIAQGTGAEIRGVEIGIDFSSQANARQRSYYYVLLDDHLFRDNT